ncbi:MAG: MFS transporter, partial [Calditrichaeota bacterium]
EIALYTSWLYLPWMIKPLWSPLVDALRTKRFWIIAMQLLVGAGLGGIALTIPVDGYFQITLAFFWLLAFSSATHDIAADGFYMLGLSDHDQAWFVGIRSTFYRLAMITGQGILIILAGYIESSTGPTPAEFTIRVQPGIEQTQLISPDSLHIMPASAGDVHIRHYPENIAMKTGKTSRANVDSLVRMAKNWNQLYGFTPTEETTGENIQETSAHSSWFDEFIVIPLEKFIFEHWGVQPKITAEEGNLALVYLYLSQEPPPGEEIVINFLRESGDRSINIIEGTRFVVQNDNWQIPCLAVIQLDPKLQSATSANFVARGGNIRLAWVVTFSVLAVMFIFFVIYHKFLLPYPVDDVGSGQSSNLLKDFLKTFVSFFQKEGIVASLIFLLFYRFAEAQLAKLAPPFLLDVQDAGGLALTTGQIGFVYGTVGVFCLVLGGLLGGFLAARH